MSKDIRIPCFQLMHTTLLQEERERDSLAKVRRSRTHVVQDLAMMCTRKANLHVTAWFVGVAMGRWQRRPQGSRVATASINCAVVHVHKSAALVDKHSVSFVPS